MTIAKVRRAIGKLLYAPKPRVERVGELLRLGSAYGGWTFRHDPRLEGTTIVSAGLGEDASFDVEFARTYGARVILVDPTPRAIAHFDAIQRRTGQPRSHDYAHGGNQPIEAYPLDGVAADQLALEPKALWTESTTLQFYAPHDPAHVSHSITDFHNDYAKQGNAIQVESTTLPALIAAHGIGDLELFKLDIEGAEIAVLDDMLGHGIRPAQLLIEFDELTLRTRHALHRWRESDARLREAGYSCGYFDGRSCFLYAQPARS